ncbi:MAG: cadmium-translocating P-type ATPase [Oscillospiraceae bacterium]|nr:cadmium-translocating P-type ATPase [Oscillospiraceae bacterium]
MTAKQELLRSRIYAAILLYAAVFAADRFLLEQVIPFWARLILYVIPYAVVGYDVLFKASLNFVHGQAFDESFLMTVATIAAFVLGEYPEATAVMLFYQVGELFQSVAVGRARASIGELMSIAPDYANLETKSGVKSVDPDSVEIGSVIVVRPGERVPLDGAVLSGESFLDTSALTGEALPRRVCEGDPIYSGSINGEGTLRIRTDKTYEDSTVSRILELVENASEKKARLEKFITRFARIYTPAVTIAALLLAVVPPLVLMQPFGGWIKRACVFLIVSCPCALLISVPLGFFGGIGAASRLGVLVKGGNYLEAIAMCDTMVFDKTGTLTKGDFKVTKILPADGVRTDELILAAAHAESMSNHPIAKSILAIYADKPDAAHLKKYSEIAGHGIRVMWNRKELLAGNDKLMKRYSVDYEACAENGTIVYIAYSGKYLGCFVISDTIKDSSAEAIQELKSMGIRQTVMMTGDHEDMANHIALALGIDRVCAELLPEDKVVQLETLMKRESGKRKTGRVAFVGDGINDAPALMRADVGVAMGSLGSDAAIEAADVVLMDDDMRKLAATVRIGRKTMRIVRENVTFALLVKFLVLLLGATGFATMWLAVFGDVGVTVLAVLNSMRCLRTPKNKS